MPKRCFRDATAYVLMPEKKRLPKDSIKEIIDELEFDEATNTATVYFKIEVKNVKAKHIGNIVVSAQSTSGLNFSSTTISNGSVFPITVSGDVSTTVTVFETNSRKSSSFSLGINRSLSHIGINTSVMPALPMGSNIDLRKVNNLVCDPVRYQEYEYRSMLKYSVESIGKYVDSSTYQSNDTINPNDYVEITDSGVLIAKSGVVNFPTADAYVVRVKVESIRNAEVNAEFDVYLDNETKNGSVVTSFVGGTEVPGQTVGGIDLAMAKDSKYASTQIEVSKTGSLGFYDTPRQTANGEITYSTKLFIDNNGYDLDNGEGPTGINGIVINDKGENKYELSLLDASKSTSELMVKYVVNEFDFSATQTVYSHSRKYNIHKIYIK